MRRRLMTTLMTLGVLAALGSVAAHAQVDRRIEANVPFKFTVGDTTLPAGRYYVKQLDGMEPQVLEISSADGRVTVAFLTDNAQANGTPAKSELVFDRYGDRDFLRQVWLGGQQTGAELPQSRAEKKAAHHGGATPKRHSVACRM
jgi:hypothetical protein